MLPFHTVFVTVGTTSFNRLIEEITSDTVVEILKKLGCRKLVVQSGKGILIDVKELSKRNQLEVNQYKFKNEGIYEDIKDADLIIGHAGAGTCMDILKAKKPGLIVVNETLMDNHQNELANHLNDEGYVKSCTVEEVPEALLKLKHFKFKRYESSKNMHKFVTYLDELMGK